MVLERSSFAMEFPAESEHLELKQGISEQRIQQAVAAFSNAEGGVLIAGVSPTGKIRGFAKPGEAIKDVHQAVRAVHNPGRYEVRELVVDDQILVVVSVDRRREGFAQTSHGVTPIRRGASNVALVGSELSTFLARRSFARFEGTTTDVGLEAIDPSLLDRLCEAFGWPDDQTSFVRLEEQGFLTTAEGDRRLTVAGALVLLMDPSVIGGRPYIDIRRFAGDEVDPDRVWEIRGPVDEQIARTTRLLVEELGSTSAIIGPRRVELPKLPERALREAIANAVAHRSYEMVGTSIHVEIRSTHVTITSPGPLPEPVTVENIRHQQAARNDRVLGLLRRLHLAEDQGRGIDRIEDDMAAELLHAPEFRADDVSFAVTLRLGGVVTPRERAWVRGLVATERVEPRAALVIVAAARDGQVTNSAVRAMLDVDSVVARSILQSLVREGVLVRVGERGGSEYVIEPTLGIPARVRHTDAELDGIAMDLASIRPVSNADLRERTGLEAAQARLVLRRLVDAGRLVQTGERRGTRYRLPGGPPPQSG